ncbi:SIR2 family protein [Pseudahrensia aquimaris]|uniref:SIR2 family protein n=1 Tax=Pseudahrensia aquimaris TaxID=744461 RepID=A0ABW3FJ56_9HYPH
MSDYFEIAYSAASKRLCILSGTGFSKAVSGNAAPSWIELLEQLSSHCKNGKELLTELLPEDSAPALTLEEIAEVIRLNLESVDKDIYEITASVISEIELSGKIDETQKFLAGFEGTIFTTNYDKLAENLTGAERTQSLTPGRPIPRSNAAVNVFHIHGSIDSPQDMIITTKDYYRFLSGENYFSRKISTALLENTTVIVGYSLSDFNLKKILDELRNSHSGFSLGSNLFFVSRDEISQNVKDFYASTFGIRVIDDTEVEQFFCLLGGEMEEAKNCLEKTRETVRKVFRDEYEFTDNYLKTKNCFFEIISAAESDGIDLSEDAMVSKVGEMLKRKIGFSQETSAWSQYEHLASWLTHWACKKDIAGSSIETVFLEAVKHSMEHMRSENKLGYSWAAYGVWKQKWSSLTPENRKMLKTYVREQVDSEDGKLLVSSL